MEQVDVLICGSGPVGLLTGYCLARYGLSTYVVEQHDRAKQIMYGRAAMIAPRSLELLEQLDLSDALTQIGFVMRGQRHYKNGERIEGNKYASANTSDTFYDFLLLCRQKYTEEAFYEGYKKYARRSVHYGTRVSNFNLGEVTDDFKVVCNLETLDGQKIFIKSRYLIGADGGRSTIRRLADIPFDREKTSRHFIRIDGIVKTDMPEARLGNCGIESPSHGSVLWACLDHGRTRVGFAFPQKLWETKGAQLTEEDVVEEAKKAMRPFT